MQTLTDTVLQAIQQNAEWAWLIVFVIAFVESLAIFGIFMPGWVLLVGVGTLIGADALEFWPIVISAYFGAVIGEYLSFYVGQRYRDQVMHWRLVKKHQNLLERSKLFFEKYGAAGVFFGRFVGPVRAVIPLIAGILEMPKRTFFWVNLTSGLIWAPLYLIPGILIGAAFELDKETSAMLLFILLMLSAVLWMAVRQTRLCYTIYNGEQKRSLHFGVTNVLLAWSILAVSLFLLIESRYYDFLTEILTILWQRLF